LLGHFGNWLWCLYILYVWDQLQDTFRRDVCLILVLEHVDVCV